MAVWRVQLLGNLKAVGLQQEISRFRTQKTGSLLGLLAYRVGKRSTREELAGILWPEDDDEIGRQKLRMALSALRRQLEPPGIGAGSVISSDRLGVSINSDAISTDVQELVHSGDTPGVSVNASRLQASVNIYSGDLLTGYYDDWIISEREHLRATYVSLLRRLTELYCSQNILDAAAETLIRWIASEPLDEEAHVQLISIYLDRGNYSAAIRQYRNLEHILQTELGMEPGPEAQQLFENHHMSIEEASISGSEASSVAGVFAAKVAFADSRSISKKPVSEVSNSPTTTALNTSHAPSSSDRSSLPPQATRFFGRHQELQMLTDSLLEMLRDTTSAGHVLTVVGPGGCGKTRLSVETARSLPVASSHQIPACFVPLADITEAAVIPHHMLLAFGGDTKTDDPIGQIAALLNGDECIFILDNFEQMDEFGAETVAALVNRLPTARFLVTSRVPVGLSYERLYRLSPLPTPDFSGTPERLIEFASVQLFVDRAQSIRPDFQITSRNADAIASLCTQLDGLPLAIELAATWIGMLSPAQIGERLRSRVDLLAGRRKDLPPRQREMRAAMDWSWELLPENIRPLFKRLSVFRGGWTLEAAEEVCGFETCEASNEGEFDHASLPCVSPIAPSDEMQIDILDSLRMLCERSLVVAEYVTGSDGDDDSNSETIRFRMLNTIRDYAYDKLSPGDREQVEWNHARWYEQFSLSSNRGMGGPDAKYWLAAMEREHQNALTALDRLALDTSERAAELELSIAASLHWFWWTRGYIHEGLRRIAGAISRPTAALYPTAYCRALRGAGVLARLSGDYEQSRKYDGECVKLSREIGDLAMVSMVLGSMGNTEKDLGNIEAARELYEEGLQISRAHSNKKVESVYLGNLGNIAREQHDPELAEKYYRDALSINRELGFKQGQTVILCNIADLLLDIQNTADATATITECLRLCVELDDRTGIAFGLEVRSRIATCVGDYPVAVRCYFAASALRKAIAAPLPPAETEGWEKDLLEIKGVLGIERFNTIAEEAVRHGLNTIVSAMITGAEAETTCEPSPGIEVSNIRVG